MQSIKFPTNLWIGEDALQQLQNREETSFFIVTDPFIQKSGLLDLVLEQLSSKTVNVFSDIVPDPPISVVAKGAAQINEVSPEAIIAIGGGSSIDAAKAMYYFSKRTGDSKANTFIAIPTTSGTGSEVTNFSVITDEEKGVKYPLVTDEIQPDIAILSPQLVKSVPPAITADTGMDVLSHLVEAYVATKKNVMADILVEYAIQQVFTYLKKAYDDGNNLEARQQMHLASSLAGMAFTTVGLGLTHGLAHAIGGQFHIPHGRLNALILPHVIMYNADLPSCGAAKSEAAARYAKLAKTIGASVIDNPRVGVLAFIKKVCSLQRSMNMPLTLRDCGVNQADFMEAIDSLADKALADACTSTNPKVPTKEEVVVLLKGLI